MDVSHFGRTFNPLLLCLGHGTQVFWEYQAQSSRLMYRDSFLYPFRQLLTLKLRRIWRPPQDLGWPGCWVRLHQQCYVQELLEREQPVFCVFGFLLLQCECHAHDLRKHAEPFKRVVSQLIKHRSTPPSALPTLHKSTLPTSRLRTFPGIHQANMAEQWHLSPAVRTPTRCARTSYSRTSQSHPLVGTGPPPKTTQWLYVTTLAVA